MLDPEIRQLLKSSPIHKSLEMRNVYGRKFRCFPFRPWAPRKVFPNRQFFGRIYPLWLFESVCNDAIFLCAVSNIFSAKTLSHIVFWFHNNDTMVVKAVKYVVLRNHCACNFVLPVLDLASHSLGWDAEVSPPPPSPVSPSAGVGDSFRCIVPAPLIENYKISISCF